jgi:hypothetical protein
MSDNRPPAWSNPRRRQETRARQAVIFPLVSSTALSQSRRSSSVDFFNSRLVEDSQAMSKWVAIVSQIAEIGVFFAAAAALAAGLMGMK